jgi:tRNA modification GTPase
MVVYFKAPNSFTGEEVVEFHLHGSIAVVQLISEALLEEGIKVAEPGEFSKRSFLNGKMDLTEAEGLADLIDAETSQQQRHAIRHLSGEFRELCDNWRGQLLKILGLIEVYIDFPDEEIPKEVLTNAESKLLELQNSLDKFLEDNRRGERLRDGISMVVLGEPNVGKSTMLNFLAKRDLAIISDIAGTTRDILEAHIDIGGYPIILSDTAGLRASEDVIEKEGVNRAKNLAKNADIKLIMLDAQNPILTKDLEEMIDENSIIIINKNDLTNSCILLDQPEDDAFIKPEDDPNTTSFQCSTLEPSNKFYKNVISISLKSKAGIKELFEAIEEKAKELAGINSGVAITRARQRQNIKDARDSIERCDMHGELVLSAEDIRLAARHLSLLTGIIDVEEVLGEIFANFCIGK